MSANETRLSPDDLVGREFAIGLRGYDRDEVDAFLLQAADAWRDALSAAPSPNGLSSTAMAALTGTDADTAPGAEAPLSPPPAADPFAAPAVSPFDAGASPFAAPVPPGAEVTPPEAPAPTPPVAEPEPEPVVAEAPLVAPAPAAPPEVTLPSRAEAERDRATAYAERIAAELDRASARTELAQAQEEKLRIVDEAQRRADAVLSGARAKAQAEAEAVLEDARTRLTPLLEQEKAARARLARLRQDLEALTGEVAEPAASPALPDPAQVVTAAEDDPDTPEAPFPVGYGSVSL
jgi:DivIVA domain-containing protein